MSGLLYPGTLHAHTEYSNLVLKDSTNKLTDLIWYAADLGHNVLAITDHECLSSHVKALKEYKKVKEKYPNFKLILGNEIYLCRNGLNADNFRKGIDKYYHFILLAKNSVGHKQLRQLSTKAWRRSYLTGKMRRRPTYYQDLIDIIRANPGHIIGSTACFRAGTQVETKSGWKNIEDICSGDFVINRYGEWEEVLEPTSMNTHQYGYVIEVTGNERPIVCTDNHEFLVITNNVKQPKWIQAKDLNLTSGTNNKHIALAPVNYIYMQNPVIQRSEWNNSYLVENQFSHRTIKLPDKIEVTPELMRLFGLFLGDGCISLKSTPRIQFTFNEKEFDNYMESFINKASMQLGISWSIIRRPENHRVDITSASADLINLFYYLFGNVKANTKHIPSRLRISKELDYELVFGYLLADGYFRSRTNSGKAAGYEVGEFVSASISKQLSYDLYDILNQLGISSSISLCKGKIDKNGINHKDAWYVSGANKILGRVDKLNNYSHQDIVEIFISAIQAKEKDYIIIDGIKYRKIRFKSATKIEMNETVYCLNNSSHSFKCENLIVHNCLGGALPTQLLQYKDTKNEELLNRIKKWILQMNDLFGQGNFFLELQPSASKEQTYVNRQLIELSKEFNIPYIITTDAHYKSKKDRLTHKFYLKAQEGDREVDDFYATTYMMSDEELKSYFVNELTEEELQIAFHNINLIKEMCEDYTLEKPLKIPKLIWRNFNHNIDLNYWIEKMPYLKNFIESQYESDNELVYALIDGINFHKDLQNKEAYDELNLCLKDTWISSQVNNAQWSAYFLNLQKTLDYCWEAGTIVMPGRGSGGGFLLLYALDIIQINKLRETTPMYRFRFLNPERVSVLDIDSDISGIKRPQVLQYLRKKYGDDRVTNVVTFKTEKPKSSILTAARGLGITPEDASYLASLIPVERGLQRSLKDTFYGNEEKGYAPVSQFVIEMTENYPELWNIAQEIEGLVTGYGQHAGGLIFVDEPFEESTSLICAPDGTLCTGFDLHDCESCSLIKIDLLSTECVDKIQTCIELLCEKGLVEKKETLKETYESIIGIYNLDRNNPEMWKMVWENKINELFQMSEMSGINGIAVMLPTSVDDLAILNSAIRLMAQEKGMEMPVQKLARFKKNPQEWDSELAYYGLTEKEKKIIEPVVGISYGLCIAQEQFMQLVQLPELGGFDLTWADKLRKSIAKKNPAEYEKLTREFFEVTKEKGCNENLCKYVWNVLIAMSRGSSAGSLIW